MKIGVKFIDIVVGIVVLYEENNSKGGKERWRNEQLYFISCLSLISIHFQSHSIHIYVVAGREDAKDEDKNT